MTLKMVKAGRVWIELIRKTGFCFHRMLKNGGVNGIFLLLGDL